MSGDEIVGVLEINRKRYLIIEERIPTSMADIIAHETDEVLTRLRESILSLASRIQALEYGVMALNREAWKVTNGEEQS